MLLKYLSYCFYFIGFFAGFMGSYVLLLDVFPDFGIFIFAVWLFLTLEVFYLLPLYPGLFHNEWTLSIICYGSFILGIILSNFSKKLSNNSYV